MIRNQSSVSLWAAVAFTAVAWGSKAEAVESVSVVCGPQAPQIERYAADELAGMLGRLFRDVEASGVEKIPADPQHVVLVGSPDTNPAVRAAMQSKWPTVTDQGLVIQTKDADKDTLIVGGGSPVATLWSVYELGHRLGIRYLFRGDIYPNEQRDFDLSGHDLVMEPELRVRTWRTVNDFAVGPESWGLEEHREFLRQLAKMKFNRVMLSVYPWHPFVNYEFGGVRKQTAKLWFGEQYPVDGDTVGKKVFGGAELFENPDFVGIETSEEMTAAGIKHLQGLIDVAHELGMSVGISISPLEFPREFQSALPGSRVGRSLNQLTIVPAADQGPTDEKLLQLVRAKVAAYVKTYPNIDRLYLTLPEFPEWDQHAEEAIAILNARLPSGTLDLEELIAKASERDLIASGSRGEQAMRGNLVGLAFLHTLFEDETLLKRPDGSSLGLVITSVDPALFPVLDRIVPQQAETLNFIDYTARRVAEHRELLRDVPANKLNSQLILTLADDNVGILPQSSSQSIGTLLDDLKLLGWQGFSTRYWVPAELDPSVYFLARASWERDLTPQQAQTELWATTTGNQAAAERLWIAWEQLEKATNLIDSHDLGFAFPVRGMLMKQYIAQPIPEWWQEVNDAFTQYLVELYRAHGAIDGGAKPVLFYYAKRSEYVLEYLGAVKAVREAALAKDEGDMEGAIEHLEQALELTFNCINTLSDIAQDQSDRGLIAVLNEYAYRPLLAEYEKTLDEE
ncbi:MAG: hypothetical protein R3C02_11425 [Planctomycetaceae bacterium]